MMTPSRLAAILMMFPLVGIFPAMAKGEHAKNDRKATDRSPKVAASPAFTNEDLAASRTTKKGALTNADLVGIEGNVTESEPGDESTYPSPLPVSREDRENESWLDSHQGDYQAWRRRLDKIEEELPKARDRAERELGRRQVVVFGRLVVGPSVDQPAHEYLLALEEEQQDLQSTIRRVEKEARQHGFGSAALMKR